MTMKIRLFIVLVLTFTSLSIVVWAQGPALSTGALAAGAEPNASAVRLLVGRSTVLDTGSAITRVSLTSPDVADALVTSPNELLINGKLPGTISLFVWNKTGDIQRYEVIVQRDLARLSEQMKQLFPQESIEVQSNGKNVVLAGKVTNKDVIEKAINVASGFVDKREEVVALLQLSDSAPSNQVLLKVRFAEVSRNALTELGASIFTSPLGINNTIGRITTQQFGAPGFDSLQYTKASSEFGGEVTSAQGQFTFGDFLNLFLFSQKYDLGAMVRLLQSKGIFQSLAEPNLVAESGKEASFLAGGEFPVPVAQGSGANLAISVNFKEFGIRLTFTPTVTGDRVHLKVRPEVSTLDFANGVVLNGFRIPALTTRRTETELELQNKQTFAIAGLLNNSVSTTLQKVPGIGDIPILGYLFKSKAAQKNQTELVVMITPEILANNSSGVTPVLPRTPEPFLAPLPSNQTVAPQLPAFAPPSSSAVNPAAAGSASQPAPVAAQSPSAASAAATVLALNPAGPRTADVPAAAASQEQPAETKSQEQPAESVSQEPPAESVSQEKPADSVSQEKPAEAQSELK